MHPPGLQRGPALATPAARPAPLVTGRVLPLAGPSWNHVEGRVRGSRLTLADLNSFVWWSGAPPWRAVQRDANERFMGTHGKQDTTLTRASRARAGVSYADFPERYAYVLDADGYQIIINASSVLDAQGYHILSDGEGAPDAKGYETAERSF